METRAYSRTDDEGRTRTGVAEVDDHGVIQVTAELFDEIMMQAGYTREK